MPNAATHQAFSTASVFFGLLYQDRKKDQQTAVPVIGAGLAYATARLPDILEPATSPNHRQFFHSLAFAGFLGLTARQIYEWKPEEEWQKWLRLALLAAIASYGVHLALDFCTKRSLPLLGK